MKEKNVIPLPSRALSQEIKIQFTTSDFPGNTLISCGYTLKAFPRKVESYYQDIRENVMKTISKKKKSFEHIREKHHHRQQDPFHFVEIILEYDLQGCSDLKTNLKCNFFPESGIRLCGGVQPDTQRRTPPQNLMHFFCSVWVGFGPCQNVVYCEYKSRSLLSSYFLCLQLSS